MAGNIYDIYGAVDSSQLTLLALFDVSAAFDTDHEILLKRLEISFACLATFLVGWVHFSVSAPFVWSMGPLDPHGSLPLWSSSGFGFGFSSLHHLHLRDRPSSHCHFCVGSPTCICRSHPGLPTLSCF